MSKAVSQLPLIEWQFRMLHELGEVITANTFLKEDIKNE